MIIRIIVAVSVCHLLRQTEPNFGLVPMILEFLKSLKGFLQYIVESRNIIIAVSSKMLTDQITRRISIAPLLIELDEFLRQPYA